MERNLLSGKDNNFKDCFSCLRQDRNDCGINTDPQKLNKHSFLLVLQPGMEKGELKNINKLQ